MLLVWHRATHLWMTMEAGRAEVKFKVERESKMCFLVFCVKQRELIILVQLSIPKTPDISRIKCKYQDTSQNQINSFWVIWVTGHLC